MARTYVPDTLQVMFDNRADLSPEFDVATPDGFKWGFELPKDVDFYIHLGRHCTAEDFTQTRTFIEEVEPDLLLVEASSDPFSQEMLDGASSGNLGDLYVSQTYLEAMCPPRKLGFNQAVIQTTHEHRLKTLAADPPPQHKSIRDTETAETLWNPSAPEVYFNQMRGAMDARDLWLLHNMKKMIDRNSTHTEGQRRKVVLFRGGCHFRFLRALEHQIEYNPNKAAGSEIVASVVELAYHDGEFTEDIMFRS